MNNGAILDLNTHNFDSLLNESLDCEFSSDGLLPDASPTAIGFGPLLKYSDQTTRFYLKGNLLGVNHPLYLRWFFSEDKSVVASEVILDQLEKVYHLIKSVGLESSNITPFDVSGELTQRDSDYIDGLHRLLSLEGFLNPSGRLGQINHWLSSNFSSECIHNYLTLKFQTSTNNPIIEVYNNGLVGNYHKKDNLYEVNFPLVITEEHIHKCASILSRYFNV
tara:strand:+ start:29417 stop:30079 length:663 start_codon:yes stop_codon:yes gene_type:complete